MTCSNSTTSAPDRRHWLRLAGVALLAALLAGPGLAAPSDDAIARARKELEQGQGVAAEMSLREALAAGARREAVAALMGEAMLQQEAPDKAREWLGPGQFTPDTAGLGFRALARLERIDGNLAAAGRAFDHAMAITPRDPGMWVEIGRLRYAGGEHILAIDAADYALKLDPENVRALRFKGELVRDSQGMAAAIPWFEHALHNSPRDIDVLGEYAATLGDLGEARKMLAVTRSMLSIDPGNPRAYFLQAAMAARAGKVELARGLLARTKDKFDDTPAGQLLEGVLELEAGNYRLAADALTDLVRQQPGNRRAALLLARANALAGDNALVLHDNADAAARPGASPYLLTLVARVHEAEGRRDLAAPLLDRAMLAHLPETFPVHASDVGALIAAGHVDQARAMADRNVAAMPGSVFTQAIAGDVRLAAGDGAGALEHYRLAAHVRLSQSLMLRMAAASRASGRSAEAVALVATYYAANPQDRIAARMAALDAFQTAQWSRGGAILERLAADATDPLVLAEASRAQLKAGDPAGAERFARKAYALLRGNSVTAEALGLALMANSRSVQGQALLAKSRVIFAQR